MNTVYGRLKLRNMLVRTFIDTFMAAVVLCAGGIVGAALLGVI